MTLYLMIFLFVLGGIARSANGQTRIACVGDSITAGAGLPDPNSQAYPVQLQALLGSSVVVGNFGQSGATLSPTGDLPYDSTLGYSESNTFNANIVVIMLGTNDSKAQNWVNDSTFQSDYVALVNHYQSLSTHPRVYICLPPPAGSTGYGITPTIIQNNIVPDVEAVGTSMGVTVIDNNTPLQNMLADFQADAIHPWYTGDAVIADSVESTLVGQVTPPPAPLSLTGTAGNGNVALTWAYSPGATTYHVYRGTSPGGEGASPIATAVTGLGASNPAFTDSAAVNGTTYYYKVVGVNAGGVGPLSTEVSATPSVNGNSTLLAISCGNPNPAPPFQTDSDFVGGNAGNFSHTVDVSHVSNPAPQAVYQFERWGPCTYTLPNLSPGVSYTVRLHFVEEFSAAGDREFNVLINGTQVLTNFDIFAAAGGQYIANVQQFTAIANSSGQIVVQFTAGAVNNPKIDGIEVLSGNGGGGSVPSAPTNLAATAGNAQVALSWTASSGATSYNVYRGTAAGGENTTPISTGITGSTYLNTGLSNGATYFYRVSAVNSVGNSAQSNEASATPSSGSGSTTIPIACGNTNGTGSISPFVADTDFSGGNAANIQTHSIDTSKVTNPAPQAVYQGERWGAMIYTIPNLTAGASYTVRLHFYEEFSGAGQRKFNVLINGTQVLTNFDIYAAAGGQYIANVQQFTATANSSGQIVIAFAVGAVNNPKIDGIEVLH